MHVCVHMPVHACAKMMSDITSVHTSLVWEVFLIIPLPDNYPGLLLSALLPWDTNLELQWQPARSSNLPISVPTALEYQVCVTIYTQIFTWVSWIWNQVLMLCTFLLSHLPRPTEEFLRKTDKWRFRLVGMYDGNSKAQTLKQVQGLNGCGRFCSGRPIRELIQSHEGREGELSHSCGRAWARMRKKRIWLWSTQMLW